MKPIIPLQAIDAPQMRQVNRSAILELIRQNQPLGRSEISRYLELSLPTVIRIVDELIEDGLVRPTGESAGNTGRPRQLLEYNKNGGLVIGIDLGGIEFYGALANIGGEIIADLYRPYQGSSSEENYTRVTEMIDALVQLAAQNNQAVLGIAVGVPAIVQANTGMIELSPSLNWRNFPLKERLAQRFQFPIAVENNDNQAALGEQWFGAGRGVRNMVLLGIGTGLGSGLVLDGMLYRGHNQASGEAGYFLPGIQVIGQRYDNFGAMEDIVSGIGIARRARLRLSGSRSAEELDALSARDVAEAALRAEAWAEEVINETADYLTLVVADIAALLNPELIILNGIPSLTEMLIVLIRQRIDGLIQRMPRLEASTLGYRATVMGAITLILQLTKDYYAVRRL